jgi:hypothetical protein
MGFFVLAHVGQFDDGMWHIVLECWMEQIAQKIMQYAQLAERGCLGQRHENDAQEKGCDEAACGDDAVVFMHVIHLISSTL